MKMNESSGLELSHFAVGESAGVAKIRLARAEGHGYDETHRELLAQLQQRQIERRNQLGGYWIAETNPDAAHHAITGTREGITWAILATDGAAETHSTNSATSGKTSQPAHRTSSTKS